MGRVIRAAAVAGTLALLSAALVAAPVEPVPSTLSLSSEMRLRVVRGRGLTLEVRAREADDWPALARRLAGSESHAEALTAWNGLAEPSGWVAAPLVLLAPELRSLALRAQFPEDRLEPGGDWIHVARSGRLPIYDAGLWQVAEWFVGRGEAFEELMRVNALLTPELVEGQRVRIPAELLHAAFRPVARSDDGLLAYGTDGEGPYAAYRLRPGEALYSSVVVRFTGRTGAEDVRTLATQIAGRNHIRDLHDIPAGFEIKIPLDVLEPEFLPAEHPRRVEAEARRAELARELDREPVAPAASGLEGVWIVLDPGHGGRDLGTMNHGIWEHDYVYDVACRLKARLERETAARVLLTLVDQETGCEPSASDELAANRQGTVQTTPPFLAREDGEAEVGVNLRWYLSNSIFRRAERARVDPDRVLFLSLHADSRHPSLRGLMVYVPGADYRDGTHGHSGAPYKHFAEVRERPQVRFSRDERVRSEALSRQLASALVTAFERSGLPVQPFQPIRDKVIRGKQTWLPAVLRGNSVPTKVLVEMLNLGNADDAALLASASRRQRIADALYAGLFQHFGERPPRSGMIAAE